MTNRPVDGIIDRFSDELHRHNGLEANRLHSLHRDLPVIADSVAVDSHQHVVLE